MTSVAALALLDASDAEQWPAQARQFLDAQSIALAAAFDAGEPVEQLLQRRCDTVDGVCRSAWSRPPARPCSAASAR